jgi:hypothetical protein
MIKIAKQKIREKQLKLRKTLWPELDEERLWNRKKRDGFTTIPRTMPIILKIMDSLSKGKPVSSTYLEIWCRAYDECFVTLNKHQELAFHAGFMGQRALQTWKDRVQILSELGFIDIQEGPSGKMSYALIFNPYEVIKKHHQDKHLGIPEDMYIALAARAIEIGADDLE